MYAVDNINELIQLNKLLDSVIQSSYDGIYVADKKGIGLIVNEAYTRITGVTPGQLLYKSIEKVVEEGIISESVTLKVLQEKKPVTIIQVVKEKELLATGNPVLDDNGEITHVVTNIRDISDLNRLKAELKETKEYNKRILEQMESFHLYRNDSQHIKGVIASSQEIIRVIVLVHKVAQVDSTVMLLGESGVGKEVFARMIQQESTRKNQPFVKLNCGALPPTLLESELFGYEKGAFTGADTRGKPGLFEQADGGTIFLDEIAEIPLDLQVKLLRVLQELEVTRIGGRTTKKVNVRIICATNRDIHEMVKKGSFREDLYYRINIIPIHIPPLRERRADIAPLALHFLYKTNVKYHFHKRFHPEVLQLLEQYEWPGNIREMENMIERVIVTSDHDELTKPDFPIETASHHAHNPEVKQTLKEMLQQMERMLIINSLKEHKTTRKTASALGISQSALVKKMQRLGIGASDEKNHR